MKKIVLTILAVLTIGSCFLTKMPKVHASEDILSNPSRAYVLMDSDSGNVLIENSKDARMPVASIVKLMTILLTFEELQKNEFKLEDKIVVSENSAGMGGSQVFLDANEEYQISELLKSVIICSANDSAVALAETISGSETAFANRMNERAKELGLNNTNYENATGLPSPNQYSSAEDVAKVLREVVKYPLFSDYSKIWMEDFVHPSGRKTGITNTNRLSRFYKGCIGGKTGSTDEAKYCLGVCAKRDEMKIIAVVLGSNNSKERFDNCRELLDYGFNNYKKETLFSNEDLNNIEIRMKGQTEKLKLHTDKDSSILIAKNSGIKFDLDYNLPSGLISVKEGEVVGTVSIMVNGELYETIDLKASKTIEEPSFVDYLKRIEQDFVS